MESAIIAIGTANPPYKRQQQEVAEMICAGLDLSPAQKRLLKSIYKATGIDYRHSVLSDYCKSVEEFEFFPKSATADFPGTAARMKVYKQHALQLAMASIQACLAELEETPHITHVITVSCTGMYAPGIDIEIVQQLHLNPATKRTVINFMGCYGAFNGLKIADAICKADANATVLLVCVELCTIHFQKSMHLDNIISNSIFSDGAAAVLIQKSPQFKKYLSLQNFYCDLIPQASEQMAWEIGDSGFDIVLSSYVSETIQSGIPFFVERLLTEAKLNFADIDLFAIHPGGLKILQACEKALNISAEKNKYAYGVLRDFGNMSSATILFVLKAIWDDLNAEAQHKTIFSCAFGPGLTLESMLLKTHVS